MPESSEVKLITEYISSILENKMITDWNIISGSYTENPPDGFENFRCNLPLLVESVKCKGKFIYFTLFNEDKRVYVLHSLRLTGRWQPFEDKYCRWFIEIENKDRLWFRDPRGFATIEFTENKYVLDEMLGNLGPDILTEEFSLPVWKRLVEKHKNKNITAFLMSQDIISGIGNRIKSEALYYSKISPMRKTGTLKDYESEKLFEAIRVIPRIEYNKLSNISDNLYHKKYLDLKIYGNPKAEKTKTADGRITHWDTKSQV